MKLLVLLTPLSFTALIIYSGGNMPYYSMFHLAAAALIISWLVRWFAGKARAARARRDA